MLIQLAILFLVAQRSQSTDGGWSEWLSWEPCILTARGDTRSRQRKCDNPPPSVLGRDCEGTNVEHSDCSSGKFSGSTVDGGWSAWTSWGACSTTCNGGLQSRNRTCTSPAPSTSGRGCTGNDVDKQLCNTIGCPVPVVAFSLSNPTGLLINNNQSPIFSKVLVNTGSYDEATSLFTSPIQGIYSFSLSLRVVHTQANVRCNIMVNDVIEGYVNTFNNAFVTSSRTLLVSLSAGDVVYLSCMEWEHIDKVTPHSTSFSGVLITPS